MKLDTYIKSIPVEVNFNPTNKEHLTAYYSLKYLGKQLNYRFNIPRPFNNVISMMEHYIGQYHLSNVLNCPLSLDYGVKF
jgi:hypothetical protein